MAMCEIAGLHRRFEELEQGHVVLQATDRVQRQWEATAAVLQWAVDQLGGRWAGDGSAT